MLKNMPKTEGKQLLAGSIDEYLFTGMNPIKGLRTDCQQHHREGHPKFTGRLVQAEE